MQFIVEKVKEQETGGKVHDSGDYSSVIWDTRDGFTGYFDSRGDNPMYKAHKSRIGVRAQMKGSNGLPLISPEEAF